MGVPKIGWFMMDSPTVCPGWCKGVPFHRCSTNLRRYCQESTRWTSVKQLCRDIHETSDGQLMDDEDNEDVFFVCVCQKVQVTWECDKPWFSWAYYFQTSPNRIISKYSRVLGKTWERKAMTNPPTRGIWEFSRIVGKLPADDWTASCTRFRWAIIPPFHWVWLVKLVPQLGQMNLVQLVYQLNLSGTAGNGCCSQSWVLGWGFGT